MLGETTLCAKCDKAVYAAEQVIGPGRKLYHKPCLACMSCNKRLDSYSLLEHDQEPYCKPCHSRKFGTRDLRSANSVPGSPANSLRGLPSTPPRSNESTPDGTPLKPTSTGSPARKWIATTAPSCGRCGKSVYFAEQVKAVGHVYHKVCLKCTECNTSLDPGRLTEKDGAPLCHRCYNKLHGPAGNGYALLGKAGG